MVSIHGSLKAALGLAKGLPPVKALQEWDYERNFSGDWPGAFRGVFKDFEQAIASAPKTKEVGYDQKAMAAMYRDRLTQVFPSDYPVMFWLRGILPDATRLFDYGGHVGIAYYAYKKYLPYPDGFEWLVSDVPAVIETGREIAQRRATVGLAFTAEDDFSAAEGADVFLASGSLQYVEKPGLGKILAGLERKPKHLILNKMPFYTGETFVTLQNTGPAFHAYYVFNEQQYVDSILTLGYRLKDSWKNLEHECQVAFHPERSVDAYTGMYFRLE